MAEWVFGYGSLMWEPGFEPAERQVAVLSGYARSFCMRSIHHRGTPEVPGLVLALDRDPGASCTGLALRVRAGDEDAVATYLRERELVSSAYREERHEVALADGRSVRATAFVVDPDHVQYCGRLDFAEQARIIAAACGQRGRNDAYLAATVRHLEDMGMADAALAELDREVRKLTREGS